MKRLYLALSIVLVLAALVLPAVAQAGGEHGYTPDGWTWDES
jgi:hypothetical protein